MGAEHLAQLLEDTSIDCTALGDILERRVQRGEATWGSMAREIGWVHHTKTKKGTRYLRGSGSRLKVAVGKAPYKRRNRHNHGQLLYQTRISIELATRICQRLDVDMIEVGL